jgi:DNA polymerase-3 subunit delta
VKAVAIKNRAESTFSLSDALFKRDVPEAIRLFRSLLESGNSFFALVKQLRTQVQNQLSIACILKNGGGPQEVAAHFPYMKGFILDKNIETARAFGFDRFKRALLLIDDFELDAKNGTTDYELLADLLTLKITS